MKISELFESEDSIQLPKLKVGDELLVGRFKNRKAIIKGFTKDKNNSRSAAYKLTMIHGSGNFFEHSLIRHHDKFPGLKI